VRTLRRVLGLHLDPRPLQRLAQIDRRLLPAALALRGMRPPRFTSLFEAFANVVPFQQLSLDAGVAIVGRLVERFGGCVEQDGRRLYAFPTAQVIGGATLERLRQCGLSSRKAEVLRALARAIGSGELSEEALSGMSTPAALQVLTALPGIGPWSASLVLLRGLGRLDVFPPGDVGAMRGLRALMRRGAQAPLGPVIERFGEQRGYLYFCALGAWLLSRGLIHPAPGQANPRVAGS
jgi:DNA-3-methyladenine glycosylase II